MSSSDDVVAQKRDVGDHEKSDVPQGEQQNVELYETELVAESHVFEFETRMVAQIDVELLHLHPRGVAATLAVFLSFLSEFVEGFPLSVAVFFPCLAVGLEGLDEAGLLLDPGSGEIVGGEVE